MSLKKKVAEISHPAQPVEKAQPKRRPTVAEELQMLESLEKRIDTLGGARICAEGLVGVLSFLEEQGNRALQGEPMDHDVSVKYLAGGLYEVTQLLHCTLRRETEAMEREVWDWKRRLDTKAVAQ